MFSTAAIVIPRDRPCSIIFGILVALTCIIGIICVHLANDVVEWYVTLITPFWLFGVYYIWTTYLCFAARKAGRADKVLKGVKGRYAGLVEKETQMLDVPTPTLFTIFESSSATSDMNATLEWIRRRVKVITEKNPFLLGRLRTDPATSLPAIWVPCLEKSKDFISKTFEKFFTEVTVDDDVEGFKKDNLPYKQACVGCGETSLDEPDQLIAKITIIKSSKSNKFAIMFSQCHVVGDGYSLYNLYSLLDPDSYPTDDDVLSMTIDRDLRYDSKIHHLQHDGRQHFKKFGFFFKEMLMDALARSVLPLFGKKSESMKFRERKIYKWFKIRNDWIDQEKKKYQQLADTTSKEYFENQKKMFAAIEQRTGMPAPAKGKRLREEEDQLVNVKISTNDVLTKFICENFYAHRNCPMYGCAYEFRSRFFVAPYLPPKPLDPTLVGNYFEMLLFTREEVADPLKIRRLVNSKGRTAEIDKAAYDEKDVVPEGGGKFSRSIPVLSNWATFYRNLAFPGFNVTLHAPVGSDDDKNVMTIEPLAAIFVCNGNGDLAVFNTCDVQPSNDKEAPLDGEWTF